MHSDWNIVNIPTDLATLLYGMGSYAPLPLYPKFNPLHHPAQLIHCTHSQETYQKSTAKSAKMVSAVILLADGTEEIEFTTPYDGKPPARDLNTTY
jgi:hypothetical protein